MLQQKSDFPILSQKNKLTYLDSAATSLKPQAVIDAMDEYYTSYSANIHRGLYPLSERASAEYEETRQVIADFIGARSEDEIIFTRNATESVNLVAYSYGREHVQKGDEIVTTVIEHHANFVPWQQLAFGTGADFKVIDITDQGDLNIFDKNGKLQLQDVITPKTKIFACNYVSNVLGTVQPVKDIIKAVRAINPEVIILIDAAQAVPHLEVNVQDLDCDFLVFSAHKMCGPTGVGVLWGRQDLLENMSPFLFGGDMINEVHIDKSVWATVPHKFEAGTPDIAGVIGLKAAVKYLQDVGLEKISKHEDELASYTREKLHEAFGNALSIVGEYSRLPHVGVVAFTIRGCHPHDIAGILAEEQICIRAGFHCAMPLHTRLGAKATSRASFYLYSTQEDADLFVSKLKNAYSVLT